MSTRETQDKILDFAIPLFNAEGTARVSCNRIADECGLSKGNLHYHYKNKEEIILAIWRRIALEITQQWGEDADTPTISHLAFLTQRQFNLMWRYRFFYRELNTLLEHDDLLKYRFQQVRHMREGSIRRFFIALIENEVLTLPREGDALDNLLSTTWIVTEYWMSYIAIEDKVIDADTIEKGIQLTLHLFMPLLTEKARQNMPSSFKCFLPESPNEPQAHQDQH